MFLADYVNKIYHPIKAYQESALSIQDQGPQFLVVNPKKKVKQSQ